MAIAVISSFIQQCDSNGVPLNAGTIDVYAAGTTTPLSLYSDSALSVAATNPITLDSSGRHAITYIATASYKLVLKNSAGTTIYTRDNIDPGVAVGSGALAIANGGTAGTTAAAARTNLAAASSTDMATAQSDISNLNTWTGYNLTTQTRLAAGTTAQRPGSPSTGALRWNSTTSQFEGYNGSAWKHIIADDLNLANDLITGGGVVLLQRTTTSTATARTTTTTTPASDNTIPQISEGTEITDFTVNFTPVSASSEIRVRFNLSASGNAASTAVFALFKDGAVNSVAAISIANAAGAWDQNVILEYAVSPGATTQIAFQLRFGVSSGTVAINSPATLGGVRVSRMIIEEWLTP